MQALNKGAASSGTVRSVTAIFNGADECYVSAL